MKALLHYAATPALQRRLAELSQPWLDIGWTPEGDPSALQRALSDTEVLWHVLEPIGVNAIAAAPKLRLIQKIGVGVNTIDLEAARARGVAVANMPGTNSQAVAEHTLMLMLATLRRVRVLDRETRAARGWSFDRVELERVGELHGRRVGFVGFGAVPRLLAPVLAALGAEVSYAATRPKDGLPWPARTLDRLLADSDVLSLHAPLTPATQSMIDGAALGRMKPGAILINTARGALVDERALYDALRSGHLAAAGLDVFEREPVAAENPLLSLDNVIVTPHVAWPTPETLQRSLVLAVENCRRLRDGEPLVHRVI